MAMLTAAVPYQVLTKAATVRIERTTVACVWEWVGGMDQDDLLNGVYHLHSHRIFRQINGEEVNISV